MWNHRYQLVSLKGLNLTQLSTYLDFLSNTQESSISQKNSSHQSIESLGFTKVINGKNQKLDQVIGFRLNLNILTFYYSQLRQKTKILWDHTKVFWDHKETGCIKLTSSSNPDSLLLAKWPWDSAITSQTPHFLIRYYLPHRIRVKCWSLQFMLSQGLKMCAHMCMWLRYMWSLYWSTSVWFWELGVILLFLFNNTCCSGGKIFCN